MSVVAADEEETHDFAAGNEALIPSLGQQPGDLVNRELGQRSSLSITIEQRFLRIVCQPADDADRNPRGFDVVHDALARPPVGVAIKSDPDASMPSGSIPSASATARVSAKIGIASASISTPAPETIASSRTALAKPPSVGSCSAVTLPVRRAISASAHDRDSGFVHQTCRGAQRFIADPLPQLIGPLSASSAVPSMASPLVRSKTSPGCACPGRRSSLRSCVTQHHADENRPGQSRDDFGVTADQLDGTVSAGLSQLGELIEYVRWRDSVRQESGHQQPPRRCTHAGNVVGVHFNQMRSAAFRGKRDGIVLGDDDTLANGNRGRISP